MNETKFTGKAAVYQKSRPTYADGLFAVLGALFADVSAGTVADIGAGTGILTAQLLAHGVGTVFAVEPNDEMRAAAVRTCAAWPGFVSVRGTAEATGLPAGSVDAVTAAQAFHWFDAARFRAECRRILRPQGRVLIAYNHRVESPLVQANAALNAQFCPAFTGFSGGTRRQPDRLRSFFREGACEEHSFANPFTMDEEGFLARNLSSSYAPRPGDAAYAAYCDAVRALFARFAENGRVSMPYETHLWMGEP